LSSTTYVLRVLSQETLEAIKEVNYSSVLGPSIVKEVQDPSLTIILSHRYLKLIIWRLGHIFDGFPVVGHTIKIRVV
jgi:hypothetical protein